MPKFSNKRSRKAGLPPGTLVYTGEQSGEGLRITVMQYAADHFIEKEVATVEELVAYKENANCCWISVYGLSQVAALEKLGQLFGMHPLVLEDIVNTDQRPKMEDYGDYLYIVLKMLSFNEKRLEIAGEQISVILGVGYIISFHETVVGDSFAPLRERLRNGKGKSRKLGVDYIAYALADAVVDNYFVLLERLGEEVDQIEENLVINPQTGTMRAIHKLKREMIFLRRSVWPVREVISGLQRVDTKLVQASTLIYLRDVYDHTIHAIDTIETLRDMLSGMVDIYLSSITNRLNEVMKVLTIITTLFIPPGLIAGVYGMNFHNMPELGWRWGYPLALVTMVGLGVAMYMYFRHRKWL
jgi:magnesium transporter